MSGAQSVFVVAVQKELRPRQASPTTGCRSQREVQVADDRAINEVCNLSRKDQKRLAASYAFSIQSRVERERSTKRLTGDCPDDHSRERYSPIPCFSTLLSRRVGRYIQGLFAVSTAVTSSFSGLSLQRSRATCRHSSNLPYLALPTFSTSGLARNRSKARAFSAFVSTNILLHLPAGFVSDSRISSKFA